MRIFIGAMTFAIKALESRRNSMVGRDALSTTIRTGLWETLHQKDINDFVNSTCRFHAKGYRVFFDPEAKC